MKSPAAYTVLQTTFTTETGVLLDIVLCKRIPGHLPLSLGDTVLLWEDCYTTVTYKEYTVTENELFITTLIPTDSFEDSEILKEALLAEGWENL